MIGCFLMHPLLTFLAVSAHLRIAAASITDRVAVVVSPA